MAVGNSGVIFVCYEVLFCLHRQGFLGIQKIILGVPQLGKRLDSISLSNVNFCLHTWKMGFHTSLETNFHTFFQNIPFPLLCARLLGIFGPHIVTAKGNSAGHLRYTPLPPGVHALNLHVLPSPNVTAIQPKTQTFYQQNPVFHECCNFCSHTHTNICT